MKKVFIFPVILGSAFSRSFFNVITNNFANTNNSKNTNFVNGTYLDGVIT